DSRPNVLIFGSYTCPPFREHVGAINQLYQDYKQRVQFYLIYIREAHPVEGRALPHNERAGIHVFQPRSLVERQTVAETCMTKLVLKLPALLDNMGDTTERDYAGSFSTSLVRSEEHTSELQSLAYLVCRL